MTKPIQAASMPLNKPARRIVAMLLCLAVLACGFWPVPMIRRKASDVVTVRRQNHLYIFIEVDVIGGIYTPLGSLAGWSSDHEIRDDLVFYDVCNGQSRRYFVKDALFGSPMAYQGNLFYRTIARDGKNYETLLAQPENRVQFLRWTGDGFLPVAEPENTHLSDIDERRSGDGLTAADGWFKVDYLQIATTYPPGLPYHRMPLNVGKFPYTFILRRSSVNIVPRPSVKSYSEDYSLEGLNPPMDHLLLYRWDNTSRITSWKTYKSLQL